MLILREQFPRETLLPHSIPVHECKHITTGFLLLLEQILEIKALGIFWQDLAYGQVIGPCCLQVIKIQEDCVGKGSGNLRSNLSLLSQMMLGKFTQLQNGNKNKRTRLKNTGGQSHNGRKEPTQQ